MRKIINDKLYDTDKCETIIEYLTPAEYKNLLSVTYCKYYHVTIYKTKKGTYLKYIVKPKQEIFSPKKESLEIITEEQLKQLLLKLNAVDTYIKKIGEVEEG